MSAASYVFLGRLGGARWVGAPKRCFIAGSSEADVLAACNLYPTL